MQKLYTILQCKTKGRKGRALDHFFSLIKGNLTWRIPKLLPPGKKHIALQTGKFDVAEVCFIQFSFSIVGEMSPCVGPQESI